MKRITSLLCLLLSLALLTTACGSSGLCKPSPAAEVAAKSSGAPAVADDCSRLDSYLAAVQVVKVGIAALQAAGKLDADDAARYQLYLHQVEVAIKAYTDFRDKPHENELVDAIEALLALYLELTGVQVKVAG